ncbi:NIPSNAP family protein [Actinomadura madurae]|uniref:NIPSNAP family protein n=1 Tax=Actinomadura madurae TaxID=1993 RepID=UPI002026E1E3|nr:NIPSNAP family protein [Actinomadura madurae]MCP9949752.1 NIPSNAP family protein [Actinomadura madurae]MCP9966502.1 NIPSNAP family protein [Actinomadura madurae]MCP9978992.1 NIPSNAP family protein [Actinomadura madurae]MCQ0009482.1 NIPSNAP family protein [Actinomadura madurae]MCQ0015175.1 NIPSNAP family protein [Actinomadura madurae]
MAPISAAEPQDASPVVELRQYTLHPGRREELTELFEREFVETQEAVGMSVIGIFHDEDRPDRFVWIRGFAGMAERHRALTAFYLEGEAWKAHGIAAAATMIDASDVLLLRPARAGRGIAVAAERPRPGSAARPGSRVLVTIYHPERAATGEVARLIDDRVHPLMAETGATPIGCLVTEPSENTFTRLPIREGENVVVSLAIVRSVDALRDHDERLAASAAWASVRSRLSAPAERLVLAPTARSLVH